MKTKIELEQDIINITVKMHMAFPELYNKIAEMPEKFSGIDTARMGTKNFKQFYNSLEATLTEYIKKHMAKKEKNDSALPGYPIYPPSADIYNKGEKEMDINPEDTSKNKTQNEVAGTSNEKDFEDDMSGSDLDIPGSELDDQQESVGSEDEENNYYSLGGDNHNDLDEEN